MNSYEEAKKYLAEIGIDVSKITRETGDYIFAVLDDKNINTDEIKCFAAPQTLPENILRNLGLDPEYFEGKKILDLGGGFGGMPFILENYVDSYVVCDPCFEQALKNIALNKTISIQENGINNVKKELEGINNQLNNLQSRQTAARYKSNDLLEKSNDLRNIYIVKQKVLDYINMRKNFDQNQHPKIIINPSKGEDIKGVEDYSQDVVLICHILDKIYINYLGILAEASRILKSDGEILIVEDADDEMRKILTKLGLEREEKYSKIVCKIKKTS